MIAIAPRPRRPKPVRRFPPEVLAPDEVRALLDACNTQTLPGQRNRALLAFVYRTGLRIREALEVRPKDLDLDRGAVRVLFAKGGRSRTVGIDAGGVAEVAAWLAVRQRVASRAVPAWSPFAPVFCSAHGTRLTEAYVRRLLPHLARRAGIAKRVHAHGLRHTHAAELRAEGFDIGIISKQLGHASIATTARYLDHIAPWAVVEAVGNRRWVS
ncbi:MAG: tyrosine-type recombinase/integrase [Phycisphaeraceae bacterium]|nr:tyrosine-type recombinase/integrase [Phycisphaeraceae bacterium]